MLAAALGASRAEVLAAAEFIRTRLTPPAAIEMPLETDEAAAALPDVIIREASGEPRTFSVEIVERQRVSLRLGCDYQPDRVGRLGDVERQWVELHARRAERFIGRLERRWETMRAVAEVVVARQRDYLLRGPLHIKPLTRAEVAAEIGVHESTVSRATRGRYVLLPSGRLMPFCGFFDAAQGPCAALARLIAEERAPRSDSELARALTRLGFPVARRTVAKYRERLGIPRHTER
jgi:RNA polymerase sigma-54 factor